MRLLLLLAVLLLPLPALASDWERIDYSTTKFEAYYVDKESKYRQSDGHVRIWYKTENLLQKSLCEMEYNDPQNRQSCLETKEKVCPGGKASNCEKKILYEVSCTGQMRGLSDEVKGDWFYIKPDTFGEAIEKIACKQ